MEALYKDKVSGTSGNQHNISETSGTSGTRVTGENSGPEVAEKDKDKSRTKRENEDDNLKIRESLKMKVIILFTIFTYLVGFYYIIGPLIHPSCSARPIYPNLT